MPPRSEVENKKKKKRRTIEKILKKQKGRTEIRTKAIKFAEDHPEVSHRDVARKFNIPPTTFHELMTKKTTPDAIPGRKRYFNMNEENELKVWIFRMQNRGLSVDKDQVMEKANLMYKQKYGDDREPLSTGWYEDFRDRHHDIAVRVRENLDLNRLKSQNKTIVTTFFEELASLVEKHKIRPHQIYNCDEIGIARNQTKLAKKGSKNVTSVVPVNRSLSTILVTTNAKGECLPPFFIHPGTTVKREYFSEEMKDAEVGTSKSGFMNTELFKQWFSKLFLKHCTQSRPVVLILDNHSSHIDVDLLETAAKNNVIIMALPPHTSHLYQPLDVGVFSPMKHYFRDLMSQHMQSHNLRTPTTAEYVTMLVKSHQLATTETNIVGGFNGACIWPVNKTKALKKLKKPIEIGEEE